MTDKRTADQIDREVLALVWRAMETRPTSPDYVPAHLLNSWANPTAATIAADLALPDGAVRASCERLEARGLLASRVKHWSTQSQKQRRRSGGNFHTPHNTKVYFLTSEGLAAAEPKPVALPARVPWITRDAEEYARRAAQSYRTGQDSDSSLLIFTNAHRALRESGVPEASAVMNAKIIADEVWADGPGPSRTGIINIEPYARLKVLAAVKALGLGPVTTYASPRVAISQGLARANAQGRFVVDCHEWQWRELMLALEGVDGLDIYRD